MTADLSSSAPVVCPDSYLTLHYRVTIESGDAAGQVLINTFDSRPATLQLGAGTWSPPMEAALIGRHEGESFSFTLGEDQAYLSRNPELVQWVSRAMLREHAGEESFDPGDVVRFEPPGKEAFWGVCKEVQADKALFDFNHPLAGKAVRVDVSLIGVM